MKVGLTGGIGSGKSEIARIFRLLGIPVLDADKVARTLMENDSALVQSIKNLFGEQSYENGRLNRPFLSSIAFKEPEKLQALNALVHPATIAYGEQWAAGQTAPYTLKEAALFFESGSYKSMDFMIGVYAPDTLRLQRAMARDGSGAAAVQARMRQQMNEEEKMQRCDFVIRNDETSSVIAQVLSLHQKLLQRAAQNNNPK
jgi:dephospho-CoA kinase